MRIRIDVLTKRGYSHSLSLLSISAQQQLHAVLGKWEIFWDCERANEIEKGIQIFRSLLLVLTSFTKGRESSIAMLNFQDHKHAVFLLAFVSNCFISFFLQTSLNVNIHLKNVLTQLFPYVGWWEKVCRMGKWNRVIHTVCTWKVAVHFLIFFKIFEPFLLLHANFFVLFRFSLHDHLSNPSDESPSFSRWLASRKSDRWLGTELNRVVISRLSNQPQSPPGLVRPADTRVHSLDHI